MIVIRWVLPLGVRRLMGSGICTEDAWVCMPERHVEPILQLQVTSMSHSAYESYCCCEPKQENVLMFLQGSKPQ